MYKDINKTNPDTITTFNSKQPLTIRVIRRQK